MEQNSESPEASRYYEYQPLGEGNKIRLLKVHKLVTDKHIFTITGYHNAY